MGNEYDYKCKGFELKAVPRSEFEALKRFGDYEEISDGTLMRMEGNKEFRIYCEDSGWLRGRNGGRGVIVTSGFCRVLSEAHDRVTEKLKKYPDYLVRLHEKFKTWTL
jgi:hypothetical protein